MPKGTEVGALWKSTKSDTQTILYGSVTVDGKKQRVSVFKNDHKRAGSNAPDYRLVAFEDWEFDEYAQRQKGKEAAEPAEELTADDIPF